ncbi:MAG: hypothetical protein L0I76_33370 [Pseudonocardia sp.]|nr:hypothetical protein [Pseudonocardia sp.]
MSTTTDRPVTIYFDTHEEGAPGLAVRSGGPTPLELSPRHRSTVVSLPYDHGDWLRVRVAAPPDRPAGITVGCELRATNGRLVARDATSPTDPPTTVASCAGAD